MSGWPENAPRSLLFVPGDRAVGLIEKAARSGTDVVIIDLEDAVATSRKESARGEVRAALASSRPTVPILIRVNAPGTAWHDDDVVFARQVGVDGIVVPKCRHAEDVAVVADALDESTPVVALLESPTGVLAADAIATAHPAVAGLAFGAVDFAAALGIGPVAAGAPVDHARLHVALAAAAAGVWAIDGPCLDLKRTEVVRDEARAARAAGCSGKLLVHPSQVRPVHEAFRPTDDEVADARRLLADFGEMVERGQGVAAIDGKMVDAAVAAAARRTIATAEHYESDEPTEE